MLVSTGYTHFGDAFTLSGKFYEYEYLLMLVIYCTDKNV